MKILKIAISILALILTASQVVPAQVDFISADAFKALMKTNDKVVVVDANKSKNYAASHVKGAINIDHNELYRDGDIPGLIKSPEELAAFFGNKGISEKAEVVIYDDGSQKYSTRIYWVMKYLGAENVKVLHRDMDVWAKIRLPLTSTATSLEAVIFTPYLHPDFLATTDYVKNNMDRPGVMLVDVRTPEEYNGTDGKSEGHIPGAININHENLLTDTGAFKSADELEQIAEANGITPDKEVIFYCRTSVRGAVAFVAFRNILGYEKVKVYDDAYVGWVAEHPVVQ